MCWNLGKNNFPIFAIYIFWDMVHFLLKIFRKLTKLSSKGAKFFFCPKRFLIKISSVKCVLMSKDKLDWWYLNSSLCQNASGDCQFASISLGMLFSVQGCLPGPFHSFAFRIISYFVKLLTHFFPPFQHLLSERLRLSA